MRAGPIVLGVLCAALVGAVAAPLFPSPSDAVVENDPGLRARLEMRVAELESDVAQLRREVNEPASPSIPDADVEFATGPVDLAGPPVPAPAEDRRIESEVRRVVAEREQAWREAKAQAAAEKQAAKDEQFLAKLQAALDLTEYQREELLGHLKTRRAAYARYKRIIAGKSEADQAPYQQALKEFVARQDAELTKLLGVDRFERLMELTTPKKR